MTFTDPLRPRMAAVTPPAGPAPLDSAARRDALVELLVLAEHGDTVAASSLQGWVEADPDAAAAFTTIRRDVDAVRSA